MSGSVESISSGVVDLPGAAALRSGGHSALLSALWGLRESRQGTDGQISIALLDPDHFHEINERFSPPDADEALEGLGSFLRLMAPRQAYFARYVGDQFLCAFEDVEAEAALGFAEQLRQRLADHQMIVAGRPVCLTLSAGIAQSTRGCPETPHQLIKRARIALQFGKDRGGNCVTSWAQVLSDPFVSGSNTVPERLNAAHWMARLRHHVRATHMESMRALVAAVDARDSYTKTHSQTVAALSERIGRAMDLRGARLEALAAASLLHDVGKIGVPDAILTKPGSLTHAEFEIVKRHPQTAIDILRDMSSLAEVKPIILHHHERFDGRGYPFGLRGDAIPIGARIIAVADAIDTMLSPRTYKAAYSVDRARSELLAGSGSQFDPQVVGVALSTLDERATLHCH